MRNANANAPTITYVTDPDLDIELQKRVLAAFVEHSRRHQLRVAFRLPDWNEDAVVDLLIWYCDHVRREDLADLVLPMVIHDRSGLAAEHPSTVLWLPWRNRSQSSLMTDQSVALSVHSVEEAREAISMDASEIVFGHVFESDSHPGQKGRGVHAAVEVAKSVDSSPNHPVVTVIGGIGPDTIFELGRQNFGSVAAIRSISRSPDIGRTLDQMVTNWIAGCVQCAYAERIS